MLVFDIETVPDETCIPFLPEPEAPANYKSDEAIAKYKAEARSKQIARMALDPAACRIVAIGLNRDGEPLTRLCSDAGAELDALQDFWKLFGLHTPGVAGYNCIAFDLPVLITRSRILGVRVPPVSLRKYGSPDVRDLMLEMSFGGLVDYKSLGFWCQRLRLDVPVDPHTGKDIAALVAASDWSAVADHVRSDVMKTTALMHYLDGLREDGHA